MFGAEFAHCVAVSRLPFHRMLVAQAQLEDLAISSRDEQLRSYDVDTIW